MTVPVSLECRDFLQLNVAPARLTMLSCAAAALARSQASARKLEILGLEPVIGDLQQLDLLSSTAASGRHRRSKAPASPSHALACPLMPTLPSPIKLESYSQC